MKNKISSIVLALAFLAGLSLLLYPTVSNYWNSLHASQAVASYEEQASHLNQEQYERMLEEAREFNESLCSQSSNYKLSDEQRNNYETLLNVGGSGIMGHIEIPSIAVSLPIYHGTDDSVLNIAVGHLEWSSLPVGGESTHCVLSGHRGLPSAKLFSNLDKLVEGDIFVVQTLNEVLTYEVDQILTVEPSDVSALGIEDGRDLCTLVTCTPYGVNTHRLLVRGHRIENQLEAARVTSDAIQVESIIVAPLLALPILLILSVILWVLFRKKGRN